MKDKPNDETVPNKVAKPVSVPKPTPQPKPSIVNRTPAAKEEDKIDEDLPKIKFAEETHNFGNVTEGTESIFEFWFTNTGNVPIWIVSVQSSSSACNPQWWNSIIAPGQTNKIRVIFNTLGRPGIFTKTITVKYTDGINSSARFLTIKGFVN